MAARGDPGGGADVYLAYLQHRPDDEGAITNVARLLLEDGRPGEAMVWARRRVARSPEDRDALDFLIAVEAALARAERKAAAAAAQ